MRFKNRAALYALIEAGGVSTLARHSIDYMTWWLWNELDEQTDEPNSRRAVEAFLNEYRAVEQAALDAAAICAKGNDKEDTWETMLRGLVLLSDIDQTLRVMKDDEPVLHARLYDARSKILALKRAWASAVNRETQAVNGFLLLRVWIYALDEVGETWTKELRARIVSILKDWCIEQNIPLAFKDVRGFSFDKKRNQWQARVTENGKQRRLGWYAKPSEACLAILKYQRAATPKPRRKSRRVSVYLGVVAHPHDHDAWALSIPNVDDDNVQDFLESMGQDVEQTGDTFGRYSSARSAAQAHDTFARRYIKNPCLNFPETGERGANGEMQLPLGWVEADVAAWRFVNTITETQGALTVNEVAERGMLPFYWTGGEVFVGVYAARALSRFRWYLLRPHVADAFARVGDFTQLGDFVPALRHFRHTPMYNDMDTIANEFAPDWDCACAAYEQWKRNNGSAIWAQYYKSGWQILPLEEAVYAVHKLEHPPGGLIAHVGDNKQDYSIGNLAPA